jgi:hypothetical protein
MELPTDRVPESLLGVEVASAFDIVPPVAAAPLDPTDMLEIGRAHV